MEAKTWKFWTHTYRTYIPVGGKEDQYREEKDQLILIERHAREMHQEDDEHKDGAVLRHMKRRDMDEVDTSLLFYCLLHLATPLNLKTPQTRRAQGLFR